MYIVLLGSMITLALDRGAQLWWCTVLPSPQNKTKTDEPVQATLHV